MFNRKKEEEKKRFWLIALSLSCPSCGGRLASNMEYIWCRTWNCTFHCLHREMDKCAEQSYKNRYTVTLRGVFSIIKVENGRRCIITKERFPHERLIRNFRNNPKKM